MKQRYQKLCSATLKRHSQLAHMHIRYHFIANLHIVEVMNAVFNRYDKNDIIG